MSPDSPAILERLLRDNELGWMIDMFEPRERAVPLLLDRLEKLTETFHKRFGYEPSFDPVTLAAEAERNPHKIRAFLQALGVSGNSDMLLMVWRIFQGLSIREVEMKYHEQETFCLTVTLARHDVLEKYETHDINDASLIRQFGIATIDHKPLFDGFFPLRRK